MKIYTKTGDTGETSLYGGKRISKADIRIESYGTVDELNSYIGLLKSFEINADRKDLLNGIQNNLFNMGAILAADPDKKSLKLPEVKEESITLLEKEIDTMNESLPELREFILPGGKTEEAFCHIARTVCRRAERDVVRLSKSEHIDNLLIKYLNRLSDYLFVLARAISQAEGGKEITWKPVKK